MRMKKLLIPAVIITFGFLMILSGQAWGEMVDRIVAVVNDDIILYSELEQMLKLISLRSNSVSSGVNEDLGSVSDIAKGELLNQLINTKLMEQKAVKLGIKISDKEVDDTISRIRKRNSMTQEELVISLAKERISLEQYREEIRKDIKKAELINQEINSKIAISDQEIKKYYEENPAIYQSGEEFNLQQILLIVPPDADDDHIQIIRKRGEEILLKIKGGESFESLAQRCSEGPSAKDGGDLGFVMADQMISPLKEAILTLKPKEVSSIIRSSLGFHIIKLLEKRVKKGKTLEESRKEIREKLLKSKNEERLKEWLKELWSDAHIEIKPQ
jgi:peptidyl-prolyl cis-trans isomerase SurA